MPITTATPTIPNAVLQGTDANALKIEKFLGKVEGTIQRRSRMRGWVNVESVRGTNAITKKAVGESSLQKLVRGQAPDGVNKDFNKLTLLVNVPIIARDILWEVDELQTDFEIPSKLSEEQGKKHAKLFDQAMFIQGIKAAQLAGSAYGAVDGHAGGSVETLALAADALDPVKLYAAFANLFAKLLAKDVDPLMDGVVIAVRPDVFMTLQQSEQVTNGDYINSQGTTNKGWVFTAFGVPVFSTNDLPNTVITGHILSDASNSNAFDGDFTKVVALVFSPNALLAGETLGMKGEVYRNPIDKHTYIDTYTMFSVCPDRAEYAGVILKP